MRTITTMTGAVTFMSGLSPVEVHNTMVGEKKDRLGANDGHHKICLRERDKINTSVMQHCTNIWFGFAGYKGSEMTICILLKIYVHTCVFSNCSLL